MKPEFTESIVRILDGNQRILGSGFLVQNRFVLTCHHVIARTIAEQSPDDTIVYVEFIGNAQFKARIHAYVKADSPQDTRDIAVLKIEGGQPSCPPLKLCTRPLRVGTEFIAEGFPAGGSKGRGVAGKVVLAKASKWVQIETETQYRIESGFSGAPAWDADHKCVIGMIAEGERDPSIHAAMMIPAPLLQKMLPKRLSVAWWGIAVAAVLVLALIGLVLLTSQQEPCASTANAYEPTLVWVNMGGASGECMAVYETTNREYGAFVDAGGYTNPEFWTPDAWQWRVESAVTAPRQWDDAEFNGENQPVVGVSLHEANAYANWLSAVTGKLYRLPTDHEWAYAACGSSGRIYPWGNTWAGEWANHADFSLVEGYAPAAAAGMGDRSANDGFVFTAPVGSFPLGVSPEGIFDLAGNVWEWTSTSTLEGDQYIKRGGGWGSDMNEVRCDHQGFDLPEHSSFNLGFRLIREQ